MDSPEAERVQNAVWRFEGLVGSVNDVTAEILSDLAVVSKLDYPLPFELDEKRNVFSWGADGASWEAMMIVSSLVVSLASLAYPIVRDRFFCARSSRVE